MAESPAAALAAEAEVLLSAGRRDEAIAACRRALALEEDCLAAHVCWARARFPGDDFLTHLRRFHEALRPRTYVEIGVDTGRTLSLARPPTLAVGVDPALSGQGGAVASATPSKRGVFAATTKLLPLESDAFFASEDVAETLGGAAIELAFVDGLHLFEQALRDFVHVERHARRDSVILFHDCLPLDPATANRTRRTGFWTGDVWKIVPILRRFRPDLALFVIPTYPTGLAVITRLDPASRSLEDSLEAIAAEYAPLGWDERELARMNLVENDWDEVLARLQSART